MIRHVARWALALVLGLGFTFALPSSSFGQRRGVGKSWAKLKTKKRMKTRLRIKTSRRAKPSPWGLRRSRRRAVLTRKLRRRTSTRQPVFDPSFGR